ncbi:TIM44-like domain-containing protein [Ferrovibrio sp.]|uniref:TIM44-like domain-containing protein n=1 Tax=Ferrovibrio sp. TaxID=1917215 RepID=UPI003D27AC73
MRRITKLLGIFGLAFSLAVLPALVEAKAGRSGGGGASVGSRGSRTYDAAPSTPTAPAARPVERSVTPPPANQPAANQAGTRQAAPAAAPAAQGGFFQRNPFMAGMMGGLLGAGLVGLLFGSGLFGSGLGAAGILGLLLQGLLIGGLVYLVVAMFRRRSAASGPQPAYAGAGAGAGTGGNPDAMARQSYEAPSQDGGRYDIPGGNGPAGGSSNSRGQMALQTDGVGIEEADYQAFEQSLKDIQAAWSKGDLTALGNLATPEVASFFARELATLASRGLANHVEQVTLEQGDLAEAWREDGIDYATVAMRWTALDYTLNRTDGSLVEGSRSERGESVEIWTFMRASQSADRKGGGKWLLSAIQQPEDAH